MNERRTALAEYVEAVLLSKLYLLLSVFIFMTSFFYTIDMYYYMMYIILTNNIIYDIIL